MKVTTLKTIFLTIFSLICSISALDLTLDLPSGKKTINFNIQAMEHYNPKPYMKQMLKIELSYIECLHQKGIKHDSFINCVGENYEKIIKDYLDIYFEFLKEVGHYINEQKVILCKTDYSRFCPDIDMFMREQLSSENLHKETFIRVFKGLNMTKEFKTRAYYDYLRHLFKAIDELIEMRKLAVSYMTIAVKHCERYLRNFKFLDLGYDPNNLERIKELMDTIEGQISQDFYRQLDHGISKVDKGETITHIPHMEIWGNREHLEDDHDSIPNLEGSGPSVKIGGKTVFLDKDSSNVRKDNFNNSVLREKEYMSLLKNLQARGNIRMEGHEGAEAESSLFDPKHLESFSLE